jgi:hypothetical protein
MTTLLEFLHPIRSAGRRLQVLAVLYYYKHFEDQDVATVGQIRDGLVRGRIRHARQINVTHFLNEAAPYADRVGARGTWKITETGEGWLREQMSLPSRDTAVAPKKTGLEQLASKVADDAVRGYIEEAVKCLGVDALRAAVVFLWTGAARTLQDKALGHGVKPLNAALQKHDAKARTVTKLDDFAYIKDKTLLLACGELGVLDKGERSTMEDALNLRNRCGHPTKYKPGSAKAASFIEDVVGIAWASV